MCGEAMLAVVDRWLVLCVARSFAPRIGTALDQIEEQQQDTRQSQGLIADMTATDLARVAVRKRIERSSRALLVWLWLPPLLSLVVISWAQPTAPQAF
jgi:hypothetical protein